MIAGEFEGLIGYDSFSKRDSTTVAATGRAISLRDGGPKPNERGTAPKPNERSGQKLDTLINKGKELIESQGGVEGLKETIKNYKSYIKDDSPSDYDINFGKSKEDEEMDKDKDNGKKKKETILGLPPMVTYVGLGIVVVMFGLLLYSSTRPASA